MSKMFMLMAKAFGCFASFQLFWIYVKSIYIPFKDGTFGTIIAMISLPPFAQIYLFIASWIEKGYDNSYGFCCILFIIALIGTASCALISYVLSKDFVKGRLVGCMLAILTLIAALGSSYGLLYPCMKRKVVELSNNEQVKSVLGIRFGEKVGNDFKFLTNETFGETYEFIPERSFRDYDHYVVLASKKSKEVFCVRAQKSFGSEIEMEHEMAVLRTVFVEKYDVSFCADKGQYFAKKGANKEEGLLIIITSGIDTESKPIVIFSLFDVESTIRATVEAGITKDSVLSDASKL